ncbi:2OG-Fe dioxygenase family protein [Serratia sp. L9]|uniref:2OG-Fe dioxygenase family protein n=1 Tax=Serratia sp. L9 TaxID=3423946 RepID=UPI003D674107
MILYYQLSGFELFYTHGELSKMSLFNELESVVEVNQIPRKAEKELVRINHELKKNNFCFIDSEMCSSLLKSKDVDALSDWKIFQDSWHDLVLDDYMADSGKYRKRRYATLSALPSSEQWKKEPEQPHYQGRDYNNLNGGIERHYEPIHHHILHGNTMNSVIKLGCELFNQQISGQAWHIEVHQFRIEASSEEKGKPTPEGVHRDGVDFVMMMMVERHNVINGETTIYDLDKKHITNFTLKKPGDIAILNDHYVYHGVSSIVQDVITEEAYRDVLVATFRRKN